MPHWLIVYDVRCPARLRRVHRLLCRHASFLQRSVAHFQGDRSDLQKLLARVDPLLQRADDLRALPINDLSEICCIGHAGSEGWLLIQDQTEGA
ncbi:MAG: CRISPR-associated endonuclease Cas2 [Xanthomonadales bacterium]|jgi:CRISPR-associated endonuclease Cas2|nr:CRISPR-associated endonuclease Cas2 [Xanthomonadales bacterium]